MTAFSLPLSRLVHENLSVILDFAFSRTPLDNMLAKHIVGEWKYLRKTVYDLSEQRANKAALELALFLRLLDDSADRAVSDYVNADTSRSFGALHFDDGRPSESLQVREVANKIIHASSLRWDVSTADKPTLVCESQQPERWLRADIDLIALATFCGSLMH